MAGGLKATFLASYVHTAIIFLVLLTMVYTIYVKEYSSDQIYTFLGDTIDQVASREAPVVHILYTIPIPTPPSRDFAADHIVPP